jgi:hypothetical protein
MPPAKPRSAGQAGNRPNIVFEAWAPPMPRTRTQSAPSRPHRVVYGTADPFNPCRSGPVERVGLFDDQRRDDAEDDVAHHAIATFHRDTRADVAADD